jgi:hypothetical protein
MARRVLRDKGLTNTSARPAQSRAFVPYVAPDPPAGSYDPAIDAQVSAAGRGLQDLTQDIGTQNLRDTVDYGLGRDSIQRQYDRGNQDLGAQRSQYETGYGRSVADENLGYGRTSTDLQTAASRGGEDYNRNVQMLTRQYSQLGDSQRQQQSRAGVLRGGAMLQAAAKRTANQAIDRQPLDTSYGRTATTSRTQTRLGADHTTTLGRLGEDRTTALGQLDTAGQADGRGHRPGVRAAGADVAPPDASNPFGGRSFQDRTTQLTRAQRENTAFGLDAAGQRAYQAAGAGWVPPGRGEPGGMPATSSSTRRAVIGSVVTRGGNQTLVLDPTGRVLSRRPRRAA